ncbi:gliding motility lipoprotein GldD [Thalassobellus sediminis]|uniref:gliding motility lipoprotein GldD n=1 Tax=Thalassobellus sediminis TaxID=3367753 RepID=UPI0037B22E00
MAKNFCILLIIISCFSCEDNYVPKPKAFLRLDYPQAKYIESNLELPFVFETNLLATKVGSKQVRTTAKSYGLNIEYPLLKATLFLTYKPIEDNNGINLKNYIRDAQNFTQKHMIKADEIPVFPYENKERKVYGQFSEVIGDVASPAQFYVTDSVNHFVTGSLYFNVKTKYDSILPSINYLEKDIRHIMETIKWK